jgi:hypothetical protein
MASKKKAPYRLAQGLTDPEPREWRPQEKYMLYARGFRDGAGVRAMQHEGHPSYDEGYAAGRKAANKAIDAYCKKIGYKPDILRLADS